MKRTDGSSANTENGNCATLPELKRLNYFYGQMLGVHDLRTEQAYFREKAKLHNRCLHGYGTVCGLMLVAAPAPPSCDSGNASEDQAGAPRYVLQSGLALDAEGNEIIVPRDHSFDPWHLLSLGDRKLAQESDGVDLYLTICYCELPVDPVRPVLPNACGGSSECTHGKLRDAYTLRLGTEPPAPDTRCEPCCATCADSCLLLAVLRGFRKDPGAGSIDNSVRRLVATYPATTITGISWCHGATYTYEEASDILGAPEVGSGIQIDFSRPVLASSLADGVIDLWVIEGGKTQRTGVYYLEGKFDDMGGAATVQSVRFTYQGDQNLDPGDRVMITVRCAFILDECCRPVDGVHVGGMVPLIEDYGRFARPPREGACVVKPPGYGPWTSGAGTPGSTFESWFYIDPARPGEKHRG